MNDPESVKKWLLEHYPTEAVFIDQINQNVNDMLQRAGANPNLKNDLPTDLKFQVVKRSETAYLELLVSPPALFFLGGLAKAVTDLFVRDMLPNLMLDTKACASCEAKNQKNAKFCLMCGEKFS